MTDPGTDPRTPRPRLTTGINSQTVPGLDAEAFLRGAQASGVAGVELTGELIASAPAAVASLLDETRLRLFGVTPTPALHHWHWRWTTRTEERLHAEIRLAAELGADYFVMPFMDPRGDARSVAHGLARALPLTTGTDIRLAVEPIGHHPVLPRAEQLAPTLRRFDDDRIGLLLDSFHWFRAGHDPDDLHLYEDVPILALQISNANERPTPELLGYRDRTFPLDGRFDVADLCAHVVELDHGTPIIVEVIGDIAATTAPRLAFRTAQTQLASIEAHIDGLELQRA